MIKNKYYLIFGAVVSYVAIFLIDDYIFRSTPNLSVPSVVVWGLLGGNLIVTPFFLKNKKTRKTLVREFKTYRKLIVDVVVLSSMGAILWFFAISKIGSGATSLLEKTNVLFVFLLGSIFLKEKIKFMEVVYVGIAISGLFFIFKIGGGLMNIGAWAILAGELLYSTQSMLVRKFGKNINSFYFTYMRSLGMFVVIGLFFGMMGKIDFVDIKVFCLITGSMFVGAFVGKYFYFEAHKYFSISKIGFLLLLESVGTVLGAYLFFGDPITIQKITGAVLIIAGAGLFIRERQQQSST